MENLGDRKKNFKTTHTLLPGKDKRNLQQIRIRKEKKDETILKKRNIDPEQSPNDAPKALTWELQSIFSDIPDQQLAAAVSIRKFLSFENSLPQIDTVLKSNILPRIFTFFVDFSKPTLQFESAWILTNMCSGTTTQTNQVISLGIVPHLIQLLRHHNNLSSQLLEQILWLLANLAGDSVPARDFLLTSGVVQYLLEILNPQNLGKYGEGVSLLHTGSWALSNLIRGTPPPALVIISPLLPLLREFLGSRNAIVAREAAWATFFFSKAGDNRVQMLLQEDLLHPLLKIITDTVSPPTEPDEVLNATQEGEEDKGMENVEEEEIDEDADTDDEEDEEKRELRREALLPALKAVVSIVSCLSFVSVGSLSMTAQSLVTALHTRISSKYEYSACRTFAAKGLTYILSNPDFKESTFALNSLLSNRHLFTGLTQLINDGDFRAKKEGLLTAQLIAELTSSLNMLKLFSEEGLVSALCSLLSIKDVGIVVGCLDVLKMLLEFEEKIAKDKDIAEKIEECGGLDAIEDLQSRKAKAIQDSASEIIEKFFGHDSQETVVPDFQIPGFTPFRF